MAKNRVMNRRTLLTGSVAGLTTSLLARHLPAGQDLDQAADIAYFKKKVETALAMPKEHILIREGLSSVSGLYWPGDVLKAAVERAQEDVKAGRMFGCTQLHDNRISLTDAICVVRKLFMVQEGLPQYRPRFTLRGIRAMICEVEMLPTEAYRNVKRQLESGELRLCATGWGTTDGKIDGGSKVNEFTLIGLVCGVGPNAGSKE